MVVVVVVVFCYFCVAPTFSFEWNKEVLDLTGDCTKEVLDLTGDCTTSLQHEIWLSTSVEFMRSINQCFILCLFTSR